MRSILKKIIKSKRISRNFCSIWNNNLANRLNDVDIQAEDITRRMLGKLHAQRLIVKGFFIREEEKARNQKFDSFWKEISEDLKLLGNKARSRTSLFEARKLWDSFSRFAKLTNNNSRLTIENVKIPGNLSKSHLLLVSRLSSEEEQNRIINRINERALTVENVKKELLAINPNNDSILVKKKGIFIKRSYDFSQFDMKSSWSEKQMQNHIISKIPCFVSLLGNEGWSFLPEQSCVIEGKRLYLDLVFYHVFEHRFLIIDLKKKSTISEINRAKNQMAGYVKCFDADKVQDWKFQKSTIGLILCLEPLNKKYFNYTKTDQNIFYAGFFL